MRSGLSFSRLCDLLFLVALSLLPMRAFAAERPNVVIVLVDDMGWSDLGCYGSEIPTPNIDQVAKDGVRFTQFYNTARCSPTRASLMTGLYPHEAGMGHLDNIVRPGSKGLQGKLREDCVTMGEVLGSAGYFTIMTGKWHLGQQHGTPPWERGFARTLNSQAGGIYFPNQKGKPPLPLHLNGVAKAGDAPEFGSDWYGTDLWAEWGLKFIDEAREEKKPFFLYLAHCAPHFPLMAPQEDIDRYRGKYMAGWDKLREARHERQIEMGLVDAKWGIAPRPQEVPAWDSLPKAEQERYDHMMAIYAAMLDRVDRSVGMLVTGLKERGVYDNTLLLFVSDNGGNAESGPKGKYNGAHPGDKDSDVFIGQCWAMLNNTPFRRYKHFTHEGGISTPLIAHWPASFDGAVKGNLRESPQGPLCDQPGHLVDLMATVVDATGAAYPQRFHDHAIQPMEGTSLLPAFHGEALARSQPIYWEHEGNRAIRDGKWKAVSKYTEPWELYDIEADRAEQHNLIDSQKEIANKLIGQWEAWAARADVDQWEGPPRDNSGAEKPIAEAKKPAAGGQQQVGGARQPGPKGKRPATKKPAAPPE